MLLVVRVRRVVKADPVARPGRIVTTLAIVNSVRTETTVTTRKVVKERRMVKGVLLMRIERIVTTLLVVRTRRVLATPSS